MSLTSRNRYTLLAIAVTIAASFFAPDIASAEQPTAKRPNVILIITDDQGHGDLACHGNPEIKTPAMDRLHSESVRLTDFHVSPCCSLTRAALMTGRDASRTGVWHTIMGRSILRGDEVTMADVFADSGYRTSIFGKWHLGDNYPFRPGDQGFQDVLVHGGGGVGNTQDYWGNDYFADVYFRNNRPEKFDGYCTDVWFDEAMKFIETNRDRPFLCYLTTNAPHGPYLVDEKYSKPYKAAGIPSPRAEFYGMITCIDDNLARLREKLRELELDENTILIFMSDNGTAAGHIRGGFNSGMRGTKGSPYEGGHRVPCFVRWPDGKLTGGRDVERLTSGVDLLPTLIDLCDLKKPEGVKFDGSSLKPLLTESGKSWPDRIMFTDNQRVDHPIRWRRATVMTDRWRLIDGTELYEIKKDPGQENDIADDQPEVVGQLRAAYEDWWAGISVRFDEECETIIGDDRQNPTLLTSHDVHGTVVWNQRQVTAGQRSDGHWAVEIAQDGLYEFDVRRWPAEAKRPITEGEGIKPISARLKVAGFDQTRPIAPGATGVRFRTELKAGKTRLQAWFVRAHDDGQTAGAYYVYARRVPKTVRVVVWDERQEKQKQAYENYLGNRLAKDLGSRPGISVRSVALDDPGQGLTDEILDNCDVLVWWGHVRQPEIKPELGRAIVRRIQAGQLSLITLHSAHWSTPFKEAMYERTRQDALKKLPAKDRKLAKLVEIYPKPFSAPKADAPMTPTIETRRTAAGQTEIVIRHANCCFPLYRVDGKPSTLRTLLPKHPIARGIPATFTIPHTEVYGEPFHIPTPDAVIFDERWESGDWFRGGALWKLGDGWVFYFRPGHETFPIYAQPIPQKILENAIRWLGSKPQ